VKDEHNVRLLSYEEVCALMRAPKKLCKAGQDGTLCVFYEGHTGLHRVVAGGDDSLRWIDFVGPS
jgi:hypothetical protein